MKKILLSLFVWFVWIISFCSAVTLQNSFYCWAWSNCKPIFNVENIWDLLIHPPYSNTTYYIKYHSSYGYDDSFTITTWDIDTRLGVKYYLSRANSNDYFKYIEVRTPCWWSTCNMTYTYYISWWSCPECPEIDTWAILSGYVPESDLLTCQSSLSGCQSNYNTCQSDLSSCESNTSWFNNLLNNCSNNLNACNTSLSSCLSNNCPVSSWWINWSSLFINWLQHNSAPYISVSIPEEIAWDYTSTEEEFDLAVSWYNVDTDYIAWIIVNQNSKPSQEDLNKLISEVLPLFIPWLVIILFIYFAFRFIKKIF